MISFTIDSVSGTSNVALTFTESPVFVGPLYSDDSSYPSANTSYDGALQLATPLKKGHWTQPPATLRGGFRYLTIASKSSASVTISNVTCAISFMPHVENMRDYSGYFYARDPIFHDPDFLTKASFFLSQKLRSGQLTITTDLVCWRVHGANKYSAARFRQTGPLFTIPRCVIYRLRRT